MLRADQDERVTASLLEANPATAEAALREIIDAVRGLSRHPYVGRRVRGDLRELVISFGGNGHVAMSRVTREGVQILAVRRQREAGTAR